jgi:uncharacterized membrane protein required for colicin V production
VKPGLLRTDTLRVTLDLLALAVLALFVALGAARGALASGVALLALGAGYATGVLAAATLGPFFVAVFGVPSLLAPAIAGSAGFAGAFLACSLAGSLLGRRERALRGRAPRAAFDRLGGAAFGAVRGALVVLLLGWLAQWVDALGQVEQAARPSFAEGSRVGALSQGAVEAGARAALGGEHAGARAAARLLARPAQTLPELQSVLEHPKLDELANDGVFWSLVEAGDVDRALDRLAFVQLAHDRRLRARLAALGLLDEAAAQSPAGFRREAKSVLEAVGPRLRRLHEDPELHRLAEDPEIVRLLERGEVLGLLRHPGFQRVVTRVLEDQATL